MWMGRLHHELIVRCQQEVRLVRTNLRAESFHYEPM